MPNEFLQSLMPMAKNILRPHIVNVEHIHLRALRDDYECNNRKQAKNYILSKFMRILALFPKQADEASDEAVAESIMTITAAMGMESFQDMICEAAIELIRETITPSVAQQ